MKPGPALFERLGIRWLFAIALLPSALIVAILFAIVYRFERSHLEQESLQLARALTQVVEKDLVSISGKLQVLALALPLESQDLREAHANAQAILASDPFADGIALLDAKGRMVFTTNLPYGSKMPEGERREFQANVFQTARDAVSGLMYGSLSRRPLIAMGVPVLREGEVRYVLSVGIYSDRFNQTLERQQLPVGWTAVLLDAKGIVVARSVNAARMVGMKALPDILARIGADKEVIMETHTLEGVPAVATLTRSDSYNLTVGVATTNDVLYAKLYTPMVWLTSGIAVFLLVGLILAWIFSESLRRSLRALTNAISAAQAGDLDVVTLPAGPKEICGLTMQFNNLQKARKAAEEELRLLAARLQGAREEERRRIAREIHDELGQTLTALKMDATWLREQIPPGMSALVAKAQEMSNSLQDSISTVRRIAQEMHPVILDTLDLAGAIEWQVSEFRKRMGIRCNLELPGIDLAESKEVAIQIFRIVQELLTNIARHADASRVDIRLERKVDRLILSVADNGQGMNVGKTDGLSLGLIGIRERVAQLRGTVDIQTTPLIQGTAVIVRIPLAAAE